MDDIHFEKLAAKHALYVDGGAGKTNYTFTKESLKEFTDLIILECVREFVRKTPVSVNVSNRARHVMNHFGVEE